MTPHQQDARRSNMPRQYEPKALNPLHHEILRRALLGDSHKEIADALGCTPATVSNAVNSGLGRDKLATMTAVADMDSVEIAQQIRHTAPLALQFIQSLLEDNAANSSVRLRAATDILDRAGHGAVKKVHVQKSQSELSMDELERLKFEAIERMKQAGTCIDITPIGQSEQAALA